MSRWEYRIIEAVKPNYVHELEIQVNELAAEGWEPINISSLTPYGENPSILCLLRKQKK